MPVVARCRSTIFATSTSRRHLSGMTQRSPLSVFVLSIITLGIYSIFWFVKTRREMVARGADVPTSWLLIVPIVNIYWVWKWCEGVDSVTSGKMSQAMAFILVFALNVIGLGIFGMALIQKQFNQVGTPAERGLRMAA
jgi:Domain of unknown function (DUF4234)